MRGRQIVMASFAMLFIAMAALPRAALAQKKICTMNADGTDIKTLVDMPGYYWEGSPFWSHDGKRIAFDATVDERFEHDHIFVVDAEGGEPHDLGSGSQPSWSADDKQLCFFTLAGNSDDEKVGVYVMNADGKARQFLTGGTKARWSNDGGRIAYLNRNEGTNTIWVYDIVMGERKPILKDKFVNLMSPPVWSPDGKQICFVARRNQGDAPELCLMDVDGDGKATTLVKDQISNVFPCWSPGDKILFAMGDVGQSAQPCWLDPAKPAAPTPIHCEILNFWDPGYSPDGKRIVFRCDR
jgi:Tol biopolymer transport system component